MCVLSISCRKEIPHLVGNTFVNNGAVIENPADWVQFTDKAMLDINVMEVFNGELYIGGEFHYESDSIIYIAKINSNGDVIRAINASFNFTGIYDLAVIDNYLYLVGDFSFWNYEIISGRSIIRIDEDGVPEAIDLFDSWSHSIRDILEYNGDILISGYFDSGDGPSIISKNVELLVDHIPTGMADLPSTVNQMHIHNEDLYVIGTSDVLLQKWTGSGWNLVEYNEDSYWDETYAVQSYQNELYLLGNFSSNTILKKMKVDGTWEDIEVVNSLGGVSISSGFEIINDELYVYGESFTMNGEQASNVIKWNGSSWFNVGQLSASVTDLILFNEKIYAATNTGIYEIEQ
jgi:hypothetical protein